jgi:hypothetical protein
MWMQYDFGRRSAREWCCHAVVLRVAGVVAVPGGAGVAGQDAAVGDGGDRCGAAHLRWSYGLTDNEKTVTREHGAGIAVRNRQMLDFSRHYGLTIATCVPADPATKGGSENAVKGRQGGPGADPGESAA